MGIGDDVTINSFMFCRDHGNEACWLYCFCDHREDNNAKIKDLASKLKKGPQFDVNERKPICAFTQGAVPGKKGAYKCRSHGKTECKRCFDWVKVIQSQEQ